MIFRKTGFILITLLFLGCSTKKNTWVSRNYHNMTAYYNVYYNGREALENGIDAIRENYRNDYTKVLPMFESSAPDAVGVASGDMDRTIEKGTKLIRKHSITKRPKRKKNSNHSDEFYSRNEYNEWVDNAYLLIGQAQYFKHEYLPAIRTLQYVAREFDETPAHYEALIWLARTNTEYNDFIGALSALESYDLGANAPEELYADYMAAYANLLLTQEKYTEAIPYLRNCITSCDDRHQKVRFSYILGQLYNLNAQDEEAIEAFTYVAKASRDYEMTFNAKVNKASMIYADADREEILKQLDKLRKDRKNKEYLDRIYWAYGQFYEKEDEMDEALQYYHKSVASSVDNNYQKGKSYISAADIYYDRFDYPDAYYYYDSALVVINEDYEGYRDLVERHDGLSGLVENILIVEREDSLQHLADMDETALLAYLDNMIATKEEEIRLAKEREEEMNDDDFFFDSTSSSTTTESTGGKWYFYNPTSIGMGKREFEQKWGQRDLEDNWRRSDKSKIMEDVVSPVDLPENPFAENIDSTQMVPDGSEDKMMQQLEAEVPTREQLMADIPLQPEAREASDKKVQNSLMEMGLAFTDYLQNYPKAIESFEELLTRYPNASNRQEALVALYNVYRLNGDEGGMASTRQRLESEFPDSRFVAYLNDPEFFEKLDQVSLAREIAYEQTYSNFLFGQYNDVISASDSIINSNENNPLIPKYYLLRGLSLGKTGNVEGFKMDLDTLVAHNPSSDEAALAKELLKHLEEGKKPVQGTLYASTLNDNKTRTQQPEGEESEPKGFVFVENEPYEVIVLGVEADNINRAIYNVADYNFTRYLVNDFDLKHQKLINGVNAIIVSGFNNKGEAMDYFYSLRERPEFFKFNYFKDNILVLSKSNQNMFYLSGLISEYLQFFDKYYLTPVEKAELDKVRKAEEPITEESQTDSTQVKPAIVPVNTPTVSDTSIVTTGAVSDSTNIPQAEQVAVAEQNIEPEAEPEQEILVPYELNKDEKHDVVVIIKKVRIDFERMEKIFTNYTKNNHGDKLKVSLVDDIEGYRTIKVEGFDNAQEAKSYAEEVESNPILKRDIVNREYYIWEISESNYDRLIENQELNSYLEFYDANY